MADLKINHEYVENYSEVFAETVANKFFQEHEFITGKEILKLTPSKQVNFMVLKNLYAKWQEETKRLESSYFDFRQDQVRSALLKFMNTVSQHIKVNKSNFQPLIKEAIEDSIYLTFSPYDFYLAEISLKNQKKIGIKSFKSIEKYIKTNKHVLEAFLERLEGMGSEKVETDDALQLLNSIFEEGIEVQDDHQFVGDISSVLIFSKQDLLISSEDTQEVPAKEEQPLFDEQAEEEVHEEEPFVESPIIDEPPADEVTNEIPEPEGNEDQEEFVTPEEDIEVEPIEDLDIDAREEAVVIEEVAEDEESDNSLNSQYSGGDAVPLHEKLQSKEEVSTIADHHENLPVDSVLGSISVNQRYMFINELFQGDNDEYAVAVTKIEECKTFDDSVEVLVNGYAKRYDWDMNSDTVKELLKMVFRRFR